MADVETLSDEDLLRRMMAGDEAAFTALYRRRQHGIYCFALHMSGSPSVAEEVVQEVFLALMRQAEQYDSSRGSLTSYLHGIARKRVLKSIERDSRYVPFAETEGEEGMHAATGWNLEPSPLDDLTRRENIEAIQQAVLTLPELYREAVVLCDLQELSYSEAAAAAGCAIGTLRSRLHRGRELLLRKLMTASEPSQAAGQSRGPR